MTNSKSQKNHEKLKHLTTFWTLFSQISHAGACVAWRQREPPPPPRATRGNTCASMENLRIVSDLAAMATAAPAHSVVAPGAYLMVLRLRCCSWCLPGGALLLLLALCWWYVAARGASLMVLCCCSWCLPDGAMLRPLMLA